MATTKKNNTKKACPRGQAWDISLGKCVDIDDDSQSLLGYSLKGGINWFGEDSPSDTMFVGTKSYKKEREEAAKKAAAAAAAAAKKKLLTGGSMKLGGTKKPILKKPLKTARYGITMKPTMMKKSGVIKKK